MATFIPLTNLPQHFIDTDGLPLVNGSLEFFLAGTDTATDLFADSSGTSIGTSITLNSRGFPESGGNTITLFRDQAIAYKVISKNAAGATIYTTDNIPAQASFDSTASAKLDTIESGADVTNSTNVAAAGALMKDGSTSMSGDLVFNGGTFVQWSAAAGLTASTTQTQGEGLLVSGLNEISTVVNTNDTRTLPAAAAGRQCVVINNGANTLQLFPLTGDAINSQTVDTSITMVAGSSIIFEAYSATNWEAIGATNGALPFKKGADVASATALPLLADGNYFDVTGTIAIATIDSVGVGSQITLQFNAILTFAHDATNLILPGGDDITTAAGDTAQMVEYDTGKWRCTNYQKANADSVFNAYGALYFSVSALTTLAAATPAKAEGTTAAQDGNINFTISTSNRLTYTGVMTEEFHVTMSLGLTKSAGGSTTGSHHLYKNGSLVVGSTVNRTYANATDAGSVSVVAHVSLATNDFIELWIETSNGDDLTVNDGVITIHHL